MKRLLNRLPYFGLLALLLVTLVHSFGSRGLGLIDLPNPPMVDLPDVVFAAGPSSLAGRVVTAGDVALAQALVSTDVDGELVWDYTDVQGHFSLTGVPAGARSLSVVRRTFALQVFEVTAPDAELVLELTGAVSPPPQLPDIAESDLTGEVVASIAGRALLDYEVQLVPVDAASVLGAPIPVRAVVGADRRFALPALLHGKYRVRVLPPWAAGGSWPNLVDPESELFVHGPAVKSLTLDLLSGEIAGRLIDSEGKPVRGALARIAPAGDSSRPWIPVASSESGQFLIRDLPPGLYRLQIDAGEARFDQEIEVLGAMTSRVDVPPLRLRR